MHNRLHWKPTHLASKTGGFKSYIFNKRYLRDLRINLRLLDYFAFVLIPRFKRTVSTGCLGEVPYFKFRLFCYIIQGKQCARVGHFRGF